MKFSQNAVWCAALLLSLVSPSAQAAPDSEIDRLLKKLPPPEKLVKRNEHVVRVADPALNDPLVKQIDAASKQPKRAFELSRQLVARYPSSAAANYYAGYYAAEAKLYPDASAAFRRAIAIQPQLVLGHFSLAFVEWQQGHRADALSHMRQVTKLEPRAAAGWAVLSLCAEMTGNWQESVTAARHLVVLAPRQPAAWVRLALAERNVGNNRAAAAAMDRAVQVAGGAKSSAPKKSATPKKAAPKTKKG
jgi:tetratricopeptide (TPR) repeat protein